MLRTVLFLIISLVLIPLVLYFNGIVLNDMQSSAILSMGKLMFLVAIACFLISELSKNYSQVDKLWSVIPIAYVWYFAYVGEMNTRLLIMAIVVTIWGIRLTYNFGKKGGYNLIPWKGEEDYRWSVLRKYPFLRGRIRWGLFNLFFISLYQHSLILLFTLPAVVVLVKNPHDLNWIDVLASVFLIGFLLVETIADKQQFKFQKEKHRKLNAGEAMDADLKKGFVSTGLWGIVRHPNYAAEQGIWLSFYLYSVAATGQWINWSIIGSILLILLFLGSSNFSEKISSEKYDQYEKYKQEVPRFIPLFFSNKKKKKPVVSN